MEWAIKEFHLFDRVGNKRRAVRDSADAWKQMARSIRTRHEDANATKLDNEDLQKLVDDVVIVDVDMWGLSLSRCCCWRANAIGDLA